MTSAYGPGEHDHEHPATEFPGQPEPAAAYGKPYGFPGALVSIPPPAAGQPTYVAPRPKGLTGLIVRLYEKTPAWGAPAAVLLCFAGAASYVWISNPTASGAYDIPTCIVKLTTGLDCPGCGGTRAFYYLMHGDLPDAVRYHAPAVFAAPFLVWLYLAWAIKRVTGKKIPTPTIGPRVLSGFLIAWAVFAVLRNIPIAPFTSLYV